MIANPIPWPGGARCACAITFDMDADSLIHIARPADSHDRLYPVSMGRYGPEVAVPRILETYARLGIRQSFFIPGWCLEQYPAAVEAILAGGHEIGHHGDINEDPVETEGEAQRAAFERAMEAHRRICGTAPRGYRAPVYNATPQVIDLCIAHGLAYDSSLMGDDRPYRLETDRGRLWEMPVHWGVDDWPPFAHYAEIGYMMPVKAPSEGLAAFWEEFEAAYSTGGFFVLVLHPFLTGRPARWRLVERWLERTLHERSVWFARLEDIAAHLEALSKRAHWTPRTDRLPYHDGPVRR